MYHPSFDRPFHVYTDASIRATGGVLLQHHGDIMQPVAFCARKLTDAETRYTTTEQELLAVVRCFRTWRCYLEEPAVILHTDHEPIAWLQSQKMLSRRQARWLEFLSQFTFRICYVKGDKNYVADALSRRLNLPAQTPQPLPGDLWPRTSVNVAYPAIPPPPPPRCFPGYFGANLLLAAMLHRTPDGTVLQGTP